MMATSSAAERGTMSHLVTANAQLSTHLAEKSVATICNLRTASRPTGTTQDPEMEETPGCAQRPTMKITVGHMATRSMRITPS
jgi:hypothetical protein